MQDLMNPQLKTLYDQLEQERRELIAELSKLGSGQFHHAPPGKWSICQILAHLIHAERLSIRYMTKKIQGIETYRDTGWWEEVKMFLLKASQRLPFKFKAPSVVVLSTPTYSGLDELNQDWGASRAELMSLLSGFKDDSVNKRVYRHIVAGILNVKHALIFFREHFHHHLPQVRRLIPYDHS